MVQTLLSSGSNAHGQLGNGSLEDAHTFHPCHFLGCEPGELPPGASKILDVASGANHTLLLLERIDGERQLWGCGDGRAGQLGLKYQESISAGCSSSVFRPIELDLVSEGYSYKFISASWETTYIVLASDIRGDILISLGADDFGDLGVGNAKGKGKRVANSTNIVRFDHLVVDGHSLPPSCPITINLISSGQHHVLVHMNVSLSDGLNCGIVVGWGTSRHGQIGSVTNSDGKPLPFFSVPTIIFVDDPNDPVVSSSLGIQHSVLLHSSGRMTGMGSNRKGQLELFPQSRFRQVGCTWNGTYATVEVEESKPCIYATGADSHGQLGRGDGRGPGIVIFEDHSAIPTFLACGSEHVLMVLQSELGKEVWGWGWNEHGNLGIGTTADVFLPVKIWPPGGGNGGEEVIDGIWAGSGTSWISIIPPDDVRQVGYEAK